MAPTTVSIYMTLNSKAFKSPNATFLSTSTKHLWAGVPKKTWVRALLSVTNGSIKTIVCMILHHPTTGLPMTCSSPGFLASVTVEFSLKIGIKSEFPAVMVVPIWETKIQFLSKEKNYISGVMKMSNNLLNTWNKKVISIIWNK